MHVFSAPYFLLSSDNLVPVKARCDQENEKFSLRQTTKYNEYESCSATLPISTSLDPVTI